MGFILRLTRLENQTPDVLDLFSNVTTTYRVIMFPMTVHTGHFSSNFALFLGKLHFAVRNPKFGPMKRNFFVVTKIFWISVTVCPKRFSCAEKLYWGWGSSAWFIGRILCCCQWERTWARQSKILTFSLFSDFSKNPGSFNKQNRKN